MTRLLKLLGSLTLAVPLLIAIAGVLAWGTIYEARFGTAAVQRFVYQAWWFEVILGFLAVNLAVAALQRWPWQRRHIPFVLAHIGIILILFGGILGGQFGVDGQMIIPEGESSQLLEQPANELVIHQPNPGAHHVIPTRFATQAWIREPNWVVPVKLEGRSVRLTVDRYYPDAVSDEEITDNGPEENPAVHVLLEHDPQQDAVWLIARDPERFGVGWGDVHVLFLEPKTPEQLDQLLGRGGAPAHPRGVLSLKLPGTEPPREMPVPDTLNQALPIDGTPYTITFKEYFPDFAITEQGLISRSDAPNNPAVSFVLNGPEGSDAYLLFALHPEFQSIHNFEHKIAAQAAYTHAANMALPPHSIGIIRQPSGTLLAVLTGEGAQRQVIDPVAVGTAYPVPSLGYQFTVAAYYPRANITSHLSNRSDEVRAEALHLVATEGNETASAWVGLRGTAQLDLGKEPVIVEYRPAQRTLPFAVKLIDFRKIDYPGTQMASSFEADVELTDAGRGITLKKKISMNNPLRHRGYHLYQSSYVDGPTQTTILSVRNDPGTPFVYAGFLIVIAGVVSMFILRRKQPVPATQEVIHA